jgi:hypothetical protein
MDQTVWDFKPEIHKQSPLPFILNEGSVYFYTLPPDVSNVFIHDEKVQTSGQRFNALFGRQEPGSGHFG